VTTVRSVLESALSNLRKQLEESNAIVTHEELPTICTDSAYELVCVAVVCSHSKVVDLPLRFDLAYASLS
jgi:hypothetical protein